MRKRSTKTRSNQTKLSSLVSQTIQRKKHPAGNPRSRRLQFEPLEDRRMLAVVTVDTNLDTVDFADGVTSLREAIFATNLVGGADTIGFDATLDGDTILLTLGELTITDSLTIDASNLTGGLTIDASGNDATPNQTNGDGDGSRIFNIDDGDFNTNLDVEISNLTLIGGDVTGNGGAVLSLEDLTLSDSTISDNSASGSGGGLFSLKATTTILGSSFLNNSAGTSGGGLFATFATAVDITDSTFSNNSSASQGGGIWTIGTLSISGTTVSENSAANGGGIFAASFFLTTTTITGSTISGNTATDDGGGILSSGLAIEITDTTISNNTAGDDGGGIWSEDNLTITDSTISDNSSGDDGGGIWTDSSSFGRSTTILESTISGNTTGDSGGGAYVLGTASITNGMISNNVANGGSLSSNGGGIAARFSTMTIVGSMILDNSSQSQGGGIGNYRGTLNVSTTTISGNSARSRGGGIWASNSRFTATLTTTAISQSTISENTSDSGGGLWVSETALSINGSIISGNITPNSGGGIYMSRGSATITGTTISNNLVSNGLGGGIYLLNPQIGLVEILSSNISDNSAEHGGGGIWSNLNKSDSFLVADSTITGNTARDGGGIFARSGAVVIVNSTLTGNSAGYSGGAISSFGVTIIGSIISDNFAEKDGGGISGSAEITDSTISGNTAGERGGGIRGEANIARSTISGNSAGTEGGGIWTQRQLDISSSTISGNMAGTDGGGVWANPRINNSSFVSISNSTISGNSADNNGGGVFIRADTNTATIAHSTISSNTSNVDFSGSGSGGGVFVATGTLTLEHTIVAKNTDHTSIGRDITGFLGVTLDVHFSLIGDSTGSGLAAAPVGSPDANGNLIGGLGNSTVDPKLDPLADNNGPTQTHALRPDSPAIDAGDPAALPGIGMVPLFDQRDNNYGRVQNGRIDIGAFEVREAVSADFNGDNFITGFDFLSWQQGYGTAAPDATIPDGDADHDRDTDANDLVVWKDQFGQPAPGTPLATFSVVEQLAPAAQVVIRAKDTESKVSQTDPNLAQGKSLENGQMLEDVDYVLETFDFAAHRQNRIAERIANSVIFAHKSPDTQSVENLFAALAEGISPGLWQHKR